MQFAGHPIIGTSWVLMNKIFNNPQKSNGSYWPNSSLPIRRFSMVESSSTTIFDIFSKMIFLTNFRKE
jgi:trans-2,3-dihydro-3-hydroxyanthranilate isomerase